MTPVHDGDAVGHRHRLFLVVGHVDERDADLLLDALQLDLHLLAQLEVEGAEGLVEEEHGGLVDERTGERHALRLAARDLAGLALLEALQLDQREHLGDALADLILGRPPLRRRPNATFSSMVRCGKRA